MNKPLSDFLNVLFEQDELTCYTDSPTGYRVYAEPVPGDCFFSINALHPNKDLKPEQSWHRSNLPRRADHNVISFRNLLIELDNMPLQDQVEYVTSKVPVSAITYSGGKSMHFIISLEEPVDKEQYKKLFLRLSLLLPELDRSCKNPSRLSRLPTATRPDTGKEQTLVQLGTRIALQRLDSMLPLLNEKQERKLNSSNQERDRNLISADAHEAIHKPNEVMQDRNFGRNGLFYFLGQRLKELELSEDTKYTLVDTAYANLTSTEGFPIEEAYAAARLK